MNAHDESDEVIDPALLRGLRDEAMPPARVERAVIEELRHRGIVRNASRPVRAWPWAIAAAAVAAAFVIGFRVGEARGAGHASQSGITAAAAPPSTRADLVLWF